MIKLIALDLDNTLLEKDLTIPEKTISLLRACAARGITIVIATGRLYYSAAKYAQQIGPSTKILCYNGCLVTEADGAPIFEASLTPDIMRKVASFAKARGLYSQFYLDHKILVEKAGFSRFLLYGLFGCRDCLANADSLSDLLRKFHRQCGF